jgi:hypothetical protein
MQKWGYFAMGTMAGIILVLTFALLGQQQGNLAHASSYVQDGPGTLHISRGSATQNQDDCLWVLHKHPPLIKPKETGDKEMQKGEKMSLLLYRITKNGEAMKLVAVRDISYDEELMELYNERPSVKDIYEQLKKTVKPEK